MNKYCFFIYFALFSSSLLSQVLPSNTQNHQPSNSNLSTSNAVGVGPKDNLFESKTSENFADRIFDVKSDSIDWEKGTLNWKGKTFSLGNSKLVKARFERYLATDFSAQNLDDYKLIIAEIMSILSVKNADISNASIDYAWSRLFDAAEFDFDGGASLSIANTVNTTWRMKADRINQVSNEKEMKNALKDAQNSQSAVTGYLDVKKSSTVKKRNTGGIGSNNASTLIPLHNSTDLALATQNAAQVGTKYAASQAATIAIGAKSVLQYQSMVISFLLERRFEHAVIACDFYRYLYKGNSQNFEVGKEQLKELFPISEFIPSSDTIQALAIEARNDVVVGLKAVNTLYDAGERYGALERLMETFFLGENEPEILNFPYEKKKVLHKIYKDASTIKDLADSKDFQNIEIVLEDLKKNASDFPVMEILAKVKAAMRASNMKVLAAKQAAALGNIEAVEKNLTEAAMIWPLNPQIEKLNEELVGLTSGVSKYIPKFDELYARGSYRDILAESVEFGMALRNDEKRAKKLKTLITSLAQVDMLIAQAKEFSTQRNYYFAWEMLENAQKVEPNDPILAREIANLAPMVADYVKLLNIAKRAEEDGDFPLALISYIRAKEISPSSQTCRLAIDRVASKYLGD